MFGNETLTMVTSMISSSVAVMTAMLMMTRRAPCSTTGLSYFANTRALLHVDVRFDAHSGPQRQIGTLIVDFDANGDALRYLDEVAAGILCRHERVRVLGSGVDGGDVAVERDALISVDLDFHRLSDSHLAHL